jgi:hypothetical protein
MYVNKGTLLGLTIRRQFPKAVRNCFPHPGIDIASDGKIVGKVAKNAAGGFFGLNPLLERY